jgi:hypothetical protein
MKNNRFIILVLLSVLGAWACVGVGGASPAPTLVPVEGGDFTDWKAWNIVWVAATPFADVTVKVGEDQATYFPVEQGYLFLAMKAQIINISKDTQQMWFSQGPVYLTDDSGKKYDLVGIAYEDAIMMAPPYLITENTFFSATQSSSGGHYTMAYQPKEALWFIEATPGLTFSMDFLFTISENASGLILQFGNGYKVDIQ